MTMIKIFLIEQLTTDEKDYSVIGMTPNFEHAVALCSRNNRCRHSVTISLQTFI